ncbi:MAG: integrase core domain-containing protein [Acidimicrobiales bacterium]
MIDVYSRMVVGWQTSKSLRSDLAIDALERWQSGSANMPGEDLSSWSTTATRLQYLSILPLRRPARRERHRHVGRLKGDSYDNSLAESFNGLYKWELIHRQGPWNGLEDVEFATMTYIDWFNHRRLHSRITDSPSYTSRPRSRLLPSASPGPEPVTPNPSSHRTRGARPPVERPRSPRPHEPRSARPSSSWTSRS